MMMNRTFIFEVSGSLASAAAAGGVSSAAARRNKVAVRFRMAVLLWVGGCIRSTQALDWRAGEAVGRGAAMSAFILTQETDP